MGRLLCGESALLHPRNALDVPDNFWLDLPLKTEVPLLVAFARSGGTLVNQLLGTHPHALVLSEVNPAGEAEPIAWQARNWLGLIRFWEQRSLQRLPFVEKIQLLAERARRKGKTLIVRDWSLVNFLNTPRIRGTHRPSGRLESREVLAAAGLLGPQLVITRRYATLLRSLRRTFVDFAEMPEEVFAPAYLAYAQAVAPLPRIHLEDLQADPEASLKKMLGMFQLDPAAAAHVLERFHRFHKCTGNIRAESRPASAFVSQIRKDAPEDGTRMASCAAGCEADILLGYGSA